MIDSLDVIGMEGQQVSFLNVYPGNYAVICTNPIGPTCSSNQAYVPGTGTGVDTGEASDPVVCRRYFDVAGRYRGKQKPQVAGVYFEKAWRRSGKVDSPRKVVVLK